MDRQRVYRTAVAQRQVREYLPARYENGTQLRRGLAEYFYFYNGQCIHEALGRATPDEVYFAGLAAVMAAAA